jgi:hypothetical protein
MRSDRNHHTPPFTHSKNPSFSHTKTPNFQPPETTNFKHAEKSTYKVHHVDDTPNNQPVPAYTSHTPDMTATNQSRNSRVPHTKSNQFQTRLTTNSTSRKIEKAPKPISLTKQCSHATYTAPKCLKKNDNLCQNFSSAELFTTNAKPLVPDSLDPAALDGIAALTGSLSAASSAKPVTLIESLQHVLSNVVHLYRPENMITLYKDLVEE